MSSVEKLYSKGAKIWISHDKDVWESGTLQAAYTKGETSIGILKDSGDLVELKINQDGSNLPLLRNPPILIGQNDLTALSYLHEPAVLYNLKVRFCERQIIYTYCGIVLVAINPYTDVPLYGPNIIQAYRGRSLGQLEPHIFAIAEEAYAKLERERCNLSIIVSGESGAGKTVSAKYAMRYFAAVGGSQAETQVERKVLASSPIMEAFGNAKTTRNDNSSRFGKFTKLLFKEVLTLMNITGASVNTYLLEKTRVVYQSSNERNYHIFYQLCSMRDEYPELILDHPEKFMYLNHGKCPTIDKVSDSEQFKETVHAMNILGFSSNQIMEIFKILGGILHLGNIKFEHIYSDGNDMDSEACDVSSSDLHLHITGELLKINSDNLKKWLIYRQIESASELVLIPNNIELAQSNRDALAKHIYSKLFHYIVTVINKSLNFGRKFSNFIGVLDIYGFETFDTNSFEQFCINYANEKLQQQFNQHVFKLEQEQYLKEGINWKMIDFHDNQPCIDLIESKLGILDLLDEECKMPKGSDDSWLCKLTDKCSRFSDYAKSRFGKKSFFIKHYSETVEYDVGGFLEKNRDSISKDLVHVVRQSELPICKAIIDLEDIDALNPSKEKVHSIGGRLLINAPRSQNTPSKQNKRSVGSQFRESLVSLIQTLHGTTPHYVRCIKPNEMKTPFKWDSSKILQQLRACGVLETVRISAAGYPSRWTYNDFYSRYQLLCPRSLLDKNDIKKSCSNIVQKWILEDDKYRFGKTQIFFRAGQVAFLEQIRADIRKKYITIVQSMVRRFIYRQKYVKLQQTALGLQRYLRGYLARQKAQQMKEMRAALILSKYARGWLCRRRYMRLRRTICGIQQYARGMLARQRFQEALENYRAVQVQRFVRGYLARRAYKKKLQDIILCQSAVRRFLARKLYQRMKAEAKTISHIEKMYKGLENKIISMQQKIDELNKENIHLKTRTSELSVLKMKLEMKKSLEFEVRKLKTLLIEKDSDLIILAQKLENERDEKMQLLEEKGQTKETWLCQKQLWRMENEELRKQIGEMIELANSTEKLAIENRRNVLTELDKDEVHDAYQRALRDKDDIEKENYLLKEELHQFSKTNLNSELDRTNFMSSTSSQNGDESLTCTDYSMKQTSLVLKLRNILEDERRKNKALHEQLEKLLNRHKTTEDSLRVSELEVENEKLRQDYELLRNSIERGSAAHELDAQYNALQEELRRRRDECIQLKAVLQEQSQLLKSISSNYISGRDAVSKFAIDNELIEAFQAQKLVNRQLESELTALTQENNAHLAVLTKQIDELRHDKFQLQNLLQSELDEMHELDIEKLKQNERYLRFELNKSLIDYTNLQTEMNVLKKKFDALKHGNERLTLKMHEHGIDNIKPDTENIIENITHLSKQQPHNYQGVMKFRNEDIDLILQRLIGDMTPRIAIGLLPGFSAYILFMCIRYTDLINADDDVRELLSKFVIQIKKVHRSPVMSEMRTLWLVNAITLLNLLKQYGNVDEYVRFNTEKQNQQLLKNFNLCEYRRVIYEIIIHLYQVLITQIQSNLEPHIAPAVLDNDEIQRNRNNKSTGNRNLSIDNSSDNGKFSAGKQLINQLEYCYKQFQHFGLDSCYSEQIFFQVLYYICAVAMNCLMLRGDICMWETGMIIRYNLGRIEDWVREKKMSNHVLKPLAPLNQVSQLLQSRKSEEDVQSICDLCTNLNTAQVLKIMKSYKLDDYESEITNSFLEKLSTKLEERNREVTSMEFTMDQKFIHPLKVVFKYSDIKLENIDLPKHLKLDGLLEKI